jgi:cytochrome P450
VSRDVDRDGSGAGGFVTERPETALTWEELAESPYPALGELRAVTPVAYASHLDRWLVTSRDLVLEVLRDPGRFTTTDGESPIQRTLGQQMLSSDGEDQMRHRRPFTAGFRLRSLAETVGPLIEARAESVLDELDAGGGPLNPVAAGLAVGTVVDVLGLIVDNLALVRSWYDDLAAALADKDPKGFLAVDAVRAVRDAVGSTLAGAPRGILAELAVDADADLTPEEIGSNVLLILFGGIETTESMILNAVWCVAHHEIDGARLRGDDRLLANATEESLRWEPAVQTLTRFAVDDTTLDGVELRAGDIVECMVGAANRDPSYFQDPDAFIVDRPNAKDHLTFGYGRHLCLGLHLARLEANIFLRLLLRRRSQLRVNGQHSLPPFGHEFRRPPRLVID